MPKDPKKVEMGARVLCPLTDSVLTGKRIKPHYLNLRTCKNGALWAPCRFHGLRVFVNDPIIVKEIKETVHGEE